MAANALVAALTKGLRPLSIKSTFGPVSLTDHEFWSGWFGSSSWSGESVTTKSVLRLGTAMACTRLLSGTVATLPLHTNQRTGDGFPVLDTKFELYELLHNQPNADMTAPSFWNAYVASLLLQGVSYVEKRMERDRIVSLDFLIPEGVSRSRNSGGAWKYSDPYTGKAHDIPDERMWRMPAFSLDGIHGLSAIEYGANVFGAAMAAGRASSDTFKHGMKSPGMVTTKSILTDARREQMRAHMKKVGDDGGVMIFEAGDSFHPLTFKPQDAELLATRDFNDVQICQWFQTPPHMVGITSKATSWGTGIEEMKEGFVAFVIRHLCVAIEKSIRMNLMTPAQRLKYTAEFALEGLLRGLSATRAAFYSTALQNAWMTSNEVRRLEGLPPMPGGDVLRCQTNLIPLAQLGNAQSENVTRDALKAWLGIVDEKAALAA